MCYLYRIDDSHTRKIIRVPEKLRRETARGGSPLVRVTGLEPAHLTASEPNGSVTLLSYNLSIQKWQREYLLFHFIAQCVFNNLHIARRYGFV